MLEISFLCSLKKADFQHLRDKFEEGLEGAGFNFELHGWVSDGATIGPTANDVLVHDTWIEGNYDALPVEAQAAVNAADIIVAAGGLTTSLAVEDAANGVANKRVIYTSGRFQIDEPGGEHKNEARKGAYLDSTPKKVKDDHKGHKTLRQAFKLKDKDFTHMTNEMSKVVDTEGKWRTDVMIVNANYRIGFDPAFKLFENSNGKALIVSADSYFSSNVAGIVARAAQTNKPICYPFREYVEAGGLFSYGPDLREVYFDLGRWTAHLLNDPNTTNFPPPTMGPSRSLLNLATGLELLKSGAINRTQWLALVNEADDYFL